MELFGQALPASSAFFLVIALLFALSFEFVNGFHDTANAVATVIYTHSLKPNVAVVYSGLLNLIGVLISAGTVAYSIVALLPVDLVLNVGSSAGFAMVFSLLISAIIWNLGTWYLGLPASSSHTLIGSIMGVGLANALYNGHSFMDGINWTQASNVFLALIVSPLVGFGASALLLLLIKATVKRPELFESPKADGTPPLWIKILLILTCGGVSFAHGQNDGQKGMGLIMLIAIGIVPAAFALNMDTKPKDIAALVSSSQTISALMATHANGLRLSTKDSDNDLKAFGKAKGAATAKDFAALAAKSEQISEELTGVTAFGNLTTVQRVQVRKDAYVVSSGIAKMDKDKDLTGAEDKLATKYQAGQLDSVTKYIPVWVKIAVALALGLGTMVGWERIVVTVGEKIGKSHLTYAQGASAELVAMATIGGATFFGMPVSTTHVLSSGIAGTMFANKSGLQTETIRNIALAWVLTLPVCVLLGATIFSGALYFMFNILHIH